jgi:hypothetical protein
VEEGEGDPAARAHCAEGLAGRGTNAEEMGDGRAVCGKEIRCDRWAPATVPTRLKPIQRFQMN